MAKTIAIFIFYLILVLVLVLGFALFYICLFANHFHQRPFAILTIFTILFAFFIVVFIHQIGKQVKIFKMLATILLI